LGFEAVKSSSSSSHVRSNGFLMPTGTTRNGFLRAACVHSILTIA
jgi:hypothetical protein